MRAPIRLIYNRPPSRLHDGFLFRHFQPRGRSSSERCTKFACTLACFLFFSLVASRGAVGWLRFPRRGRSGHVWRFSRRAQGRGAQGKRDAGSLSPACFSPAGRSPDGRARAHACQREHAPKNSTRRALGASTRAVEFAMQPAISVLQSPL
jgi:hypothetical protein